MPLRKHSVAFRLQGGVNTKTDEKLVPSTQLLALENGVFGRGISIQKRNGYEALAEMPDARRLAKHGNELLGFTSDRCYSYDPANNELVDTGAVFSVVANDRPAVRTGTEQTAPDHATSGGVTAYAWEDSRGGVWWAAVSAETGRFLRGPEQLDANGQRPRCVPAGPSIHVYWARPTQLAVYCAVVNPSEPTVAVTPVLIVEDLNSSNPVYDACPTDREGTPAAIAWHEHGTTRVRFGYVDASGVLGSPATGHPSIVTINAAITAASPIGVAYRDEQIAVAYQFSAEGSGVAVSVYDSPDDTTAPSFAYGNSASVTLADRLTIALTEDRAWFAIEEHATEASEHYCRVGYCDSDGGISSQLLRSVALASRAFTVGTNAFAVFVHDTTYFNVYLTKRLSDLADVGRHMPGLASDMPARSHVPSAHVVSDVASVALPYNERLLSENNDQFTETGVRLVTMDFDSEDSHQYAELGRGTYLAGACPMHYDGRIWTEQGFHVGPELIEATPSNTSGGQMTPSATYVYRAWYEWTDAQGEVHRGPTSIGTTVTMGASDDTVALTLPTLRLTNKPNVRICVARSRANDETEWFRITSSDPNTDGDDNGYIANDTTVDSVSFVDEMSDAVLRTQEPLYTNGGILPNDPSPLGAVVAGGKSRLFYTDPSDGNAVRYSQELAEGYGAECPPELRLVCDPFGGDVTAIGVMDDLVYAFKESAIFVAGGDGPLPNGDASQSGFTKFQLITSDVGCTDPNSIALTPVGLMFKSRKGIYLLGRDRSVQYAGALVEGYNAQSVRRATVLPDRTAVLFLTDDGKSLYYDYYFQQWSTFTNHAGYDAVVVGGSYHYLRTDGRIFKETPGSYSDAGRRIPLLFETAHLHMVEHNQGWQRFYHVHVLGTRKSPHQLKIQWRSDYGGHWSDPAWMDATGADSATGWVTGDRAGTIGAENIEGSGYGEGNYGDGVYGGSAPGLYQWRAHLGIVGQSVQLRFSDYEADGFTGAGYELSELVITGGVKSAVKKPFSAGRST